MPLDKDTLETKIKEAFEKAKNTPSPPPGKPEEAEGIQVEILKNLAADLANAIDAYVKSGDVKNVKVNVQLDVMDLSNTKIGTAAGTASQKTGEYGNIE